MIHTALKEWAVICDLLVAGEQSLLIRKGGIEEAGGPGRFRLEVPRFALFPAWLHQVPERIKSQWRVRVKVFDKEPAEVPIAGIGVVDHVWQVPSRHSLDALDDLHAWTPEQLDMRWNYKPHQPLFLLAVRVDRLPIPRTITNNSRYAGCKSWVELDAADGIDDRDSTPALDDAVFDRIIHQIDVSMQSI